MEPNVDPGSPMSGDRVPNISPLDIVEKRIMRYFVGLVACGCVVASLAASAKATTYIYNLNQLTPDQLPGNAGWNSGGPGGGGLDSESVVANNDTLTLTNPSGGRGFYYYLNSGAGFAGLSSTSEYELRVRATPTTDYGGSGGAGAAIFSAAVADGSRFISLGFAYNLPPVDTGYDFYFTSSGYAPLGTSTRYSEAVPGVPKFYDILLKKIGTTGTAADTVQLYVDNVLRVTDSYTNFSAVAYKELSWGQSSGSSTGTALVNGVTYGLGEAAPLIVTPVPEPTTALLAVFGAIIVLARRRR
jgi:hypothetical protein